MITVASDPEILTWGHFTEEPNRWSDVVVADISRTITMPAKADVVEKNGKFSLGSFTITVKLDKSQTRVLKGQQSPELLAHEQGHLDISKLSARAVAKELSELSESSPQKLSDALQKVLAKHGALIDEADKGYDANTGGGAKADMQSKWANAIRIALSASAPPVVEGYAL